MRAAWPVKVLLMLLVLVFAGCSSHPEPNSRTPAQASEITVSEQPPPETTQVSGAPVNITPGTDRLWQNGPSQEDLQRGSYAEKHAKRVSGTRNKSGDNVPVLLDIPTQSKPSTTLNHGLDP